MKKIILLIVVVALAYGYVQENGISIPSLSAWSHSADSSLQAAYDNRQSDLQVQGEGVVKRVLSDDIDGSRHQRFILKLSTGQTLLIAHNIDLAPRISGLRTGDRVEFYGEYEWNAKGGVIHWTHHDPNGRHVGGWLKHGGRTYQ
ncbi:MAG: DUF3465 domain-containing protein [Pseudomonadota bacterium]